MTIEGCETTCLVLEPAEVSGGATRTENPFPKVPGLRQKALLRDAVADVVPRYVLDRPKQGFCPPVGAWSASLLADRMNGASARGDEGVVAPDATSRLRPNVPHTSLTNCDCAVLDFPVTDDEHVRHLLELSVSDLLAGRLDAVIDLHGYIPSS